MEMRLRQLADAVYKSYSTVLLTASNLPISMLSRSSLQVGTPHFRKIGHGQGKAGAKLSWFVAAFINQAMRKIYHWPISTLNTTSKMQFI